MAELYLEFETKHTCPDCSAQFVNEARPVPGRPFRCPKCAKARAQKRSQKHNAKRKLRKESREGQHRL